jgi:hypothetical protein
MKPPIALPSLQTHLARIVLLCTLAVLASVSVLGQTKQPYIKIGSHEVNLGMPTDKLVTLLLRDYKVSPSDEAPVRLWFVSTAKDTETLGIIYSKGNTVVGIKHLLLERDTDSPQDIFDALFAASSRLSNEGRNTCVVTTGTAYLPGEVGLSKATVQFSCGAYRIILLRNEFKGARGNEVAGYSVWEEIGSTD